MIETTHALSFEAETNHLYSFFEPIWKNSFGEEVKAFADENGLRLMGICDGHYVVLGAHTTEVENVSGEGLIRCDTEDLKRVFSAAKKVGERAVVKVGDTLTVKVDRSIYRAPLLAKECKLRIPDIPADTWVEVDSDRLKAVVSALKIAEKGSPVTFTVGDGSFFINPEEGQEHVSQLSRGSELFVCDAEGTAEVSVGEDLLSSVVACLKKGPVHVGIKDEVPLQFKQEWETGSFHILIAPRAENGGG